MRIALPRPRSAAFAARIAAGAAAATLAGAGPAVAKSATGTRPVQRTVQVSVYFVQGERLAAVPRTVAIPGLLQGVLLELLAEPNAKERRSGLATAVPAGTRLRGVTIFDGLVTVDLSRRFESGGGSLSMTARLAQLTRALTQFSQVRGVLLRLDGRPARVFGGEGLILDHPLTRADFRELG